MRVVGACMIQLETAYKTATIGFNTYLDTTNDPLLLIAKENEKKKNKKKQDEKVSISSQATIFNFQPP